VLDSPWFGGDAVDLVADDFGGGLVFNHEVGSPLPYPGGREGQVLVVSGTPADREVAAAREAFGVIVHLEFALHVVVHA